LKKRYIRWIKIILLVYAILGIAFFYLQDRILFHPIAIPKDQQYDFRDAYREINIPYDRETNINIIQFYPKDDTLPKGVVLYFHGNKNNIGWYAKYASNFTTSHYEVWMMDYPGYGKSTGTFSEQKLYDYALQVYKLARTHYEPGRIVIYGKSLGTGIASQLASVRDCKYLIMETPFYSMTSLAAHYLPIYPVKQMMHFRFPTYEYLKQVTAPIVILHGSSDGIIPFAQSKRLLPFLKAGDQLVRIPNGSHNDLGEYPLFHQKLDSLLSN
jgi:uncharacterized protein